MMEMNDSSTVDVTNRWLVQIALKPWEAAKNICALEDANKAQCRLIQEYREMRTSEACKSPDPEKVEPWNRLIEAVGRCKAVIFARRANMVSYRSTQEHPCRRLSFVHP